MESTQSSPSSNPSIPLQTSQFYPSMFMSTNNLTHNFNLNHDEEEEEEEDELDDQMSIDKTEREPMFEKPLTPSDVGKLNRLVIPKQHAERYFPLGGGGGSDSADNKGLLLSFEDESGKCWRFRYSYWNSSQSYVLTKGWSRYVKEKQLDAGDIILFQRHRIDGDRLFIGWRRRGAAVVVTAAAATDGGNAVTGNYSGGGGAGGRGLYQGHPYLGHIQSLGANVPYQLDCLHAGNVVQNRGTTARNPKRLVRLFGVNLECHQLDDSPPSTPASSTVSSQGPTTHPFY